MSQTIIHNFSPEIQYITQLVLLFNECSHECKFCCEIGKDAHNIQRFCFHCPVIKFSTVETGQARIYEILMQLSLIDTENGLKDFGFWGVVLASPRSAKIINELIRSLGICSDKLAALTWFTVGEATSAALTKNTNIETIGGRGAGSASLLLPFIIKSYTEKLLTELSRKQKLLFVAGNIRGDVITKGLESDSIIYEEVIVYKTVPLQNVCIAEEFSGSRSNQTVNRSAVFFSPSGVKCVEKQCFLAADISLIAIGKTTAGALEASSLKEGRKIHVAPSPSPAGILCILDSLI